MKTYTSILSIFGTLLLIIFLTGEARAQRRYKHIKKARTEEGFLTPSKSSEKSKTKEISPIGNETVTRTADLEQAVTAEIPFEKSEEVASAEKNIQIPVKKRPSSVKALFKNETTIETANRLFFSNQAMASVGLDKALSPERTKGNPGLAFLIMGAVFLGVGLTLFISSFFLLFIDDILGFVALLLIGLALMIVGAVFLPIGIVKFVKYKRGK